MDQVALVSAGLVRDNEFDGCPGHVVLASGRVPMIDGGSTHAVKVSVH
jgi:hypothetical protein